MSAGKRAISPLQEAVVVGAAAFAVYLLTRTRDFGGDDTVYAMAVDSFASGHGLSREVFHPHHPLYNPLVAALVWLLRLVGSRPFVPDVGAGVSALFAALVVGGLVFVLRRAAFGAGNALLVALVAATCGGLWQYAVFMEVYAMTAAAVLLWLAIASREPPDPVRVGASLAAAILSHLTAGLLIVPTVLRLRRRPRAALGTVVIALGSACVCLLTIFVLFHHAFSPRQWWRTVLPGYGDYLRLPDPAGMARALRGLVVWDWYDEVPVLSSGTNHLLDLAGQLSVIVLLGLLMLGVLAAVRHRHPLAMTALGGLAAYLPLWLCWDTGNVEHAVAAVPLFAVLIAFGAATLPRRLGAAALLLAVVLLGAVNGLASAVLQARAENSRACVIASFVGSTLPKDALLLTVGADARLHLALPYLAGRRVVDLVLDANSAHLQRRTPAEAVAYWYSAAQSSGDVWVTPDVLDEVGAHRVKGLGVPQQTWSTIVSTFVPLQRRTLAPDGIVVRQPFVLTQIRMAR